VVGPGGGGGLGIFFILGKIFSNVLKLCVLHDLNCMAVREIWRFFY